MSWPDLSSRSRELRGGRLISSCNCVRRNGLQDDCERSECQGRSKCLTRPFPKCCPSIFANRFEAISMGKRTNSHQSDRKIRMLNNGRYAILYDPNTKVKPRNQNNRIDRIDRVW